MDGLCTLSLTLGYHGAPFSGFARQEGQLTVQGEVEDALAVLFRRDVPTVGAGRTDAGVHARGQVMSFQLEDGELAERSLANLQRSLNAITHPAISIRSVDERPDGFSARFSATAREYRYFIAQERWRPIFMGDFSWHVGEQLDEAAMREAAQLLIGEHDFKSFCVTASAEGKPTCRNVMGIDIAEADMMGEPMLVITVTGNAFLHSMVRTMVGTLVQVGKGKHPASWVGDVLAACDRRAAGETAPAQGLVFWEVRY